MARPAYFPHQQHTWLECETCHHDVGASGKPVRYTPGNQVERCESCHNKKADMPAQWASFKRVGHGFCMECHVQNATDQARCGACHIPQLSHVSKQEEHTNE
ncbi:MAG: cytochrome c3 family protein [Fibrobacter sp.]|nr:cytochrome c3 family protein [Fibrobacter sp.]